MTTTDELRRRLDRARQLLASSGQAAFVASPGADLRYLCGHDVHLNERITALVVRANAEPVLVTPVLEKAVALHSPIGALGLDVATWNETDDPYALINELAGGPSIAVSERMWAQHMFGMHAAGEVSLSSGADLMADLRAVKSAEEIESLRRAAHAIDSVHHDMDRWLRAGRTENEVAAESVGIHTARVKIQAFVMAAAFAGIGGALFAHELGTTLNPRELGFQKSIDLVIMVVLGGMGSIMGSILTGFALGLIEGLTKFYYPAASNTVVFVLMALVLLVRPAGLFGKAP